jgi:tetratricopeptide (TPR) repeat protein
MDATVATLEMLVAEARQVELAGDAVGASTAWERVCTLFPDAPTGYIGCAKALKRQGDTAAASKVLVAGIAVCPSDERLAEEHAWLAYESHDWAEANARWERVRKRFPDSYPAYAAGATALRYLGRFDEAESMYRQTFERWPATTDFGFLTDYDECAHTRRDVDEAARRWTLLRKLHSGNPKGYVRGAANFSLAGRHDEAESLLREALSRCSGDVEVKAEFARLAERQADHQEILRRWEAVVKEFPGFADGYIGSAHALYELGRFSDAQTTLRPAIRMFPDSMHVADLQARLAYRQDRFEEARTLWSEFRRRFPHNPAGFCGEVDALIGLNRYRDADALIHEGRSVFPRDEHVAMSWCLVAEEAQNFEESEYRWGVCYARLASFAPMRAGYARILCQNKKFDEAEALLIPIVQEPESDLDLVATYAHCATERGEWNEAESRWRTVIQRFPKAAAGWVGLGDMLRLCGRLEESARVLETALRSFSNDADLEQSLAWPTNFRRQWPEALRMWAELKRKYPNNPSVLSGTTAALWEAKQVLGIAQSEGIAAPFDIPESLLNDNDDGSDDQGAVKRMLLRFESLGDSCEFGIVQRRYSAEPIGLLRWATTDPPQLTQALLSRLEGVGEPEHTVIEDIRGEYISWDRRYAMYNHTFTPPTLEPLDSFVPQHLRRLQYLRRKLIEDLEAGRKIFVYKSDDGLPDDQATALHDAIRGYNDRNILLCVRLQDRDHPVGALEELQSGLFIGYIDRYSTVDINIAVWLDLCRATLARLTP